jgi:putative glutathione S-transferase
MKGLDDAISYSIVHPTWQKTRPEDESDPHHGWAYKAPGDEPLSNPLGHGSYKCDDLLVRDESTNAKSVREVYNMCGDEEGPFTTPLLYDKKTKTIVNNESTEILKMLNFEFNEVATKPDLDFYPEDIQEELQELNDSLVYPKVNNGVYRCGFATSQESYDAAVGELFESLEILEEKLSKQRYLGGDRFTWLDLRLFMTLVRFDPVYITYFKTNKKRIVDYPNLLGFVRDIYSIEEVKNTLSIEHIKTHYFTSHPVLNTYGIIPAYDGPDLTVPSGRENMK